VQYIAKHVIMNLMWIAMLFTPIRKKFKSTGNINIFSRHGRKLFHVRPSCHTEKSNQKQDHQVSTTEGMIDMTVVRDMTPRRRSVCGFDTVAHQVSIHEHRRIEYRDAITVQME
jgi:hypothetical protein